MVYLTMTAAIVQGIEQVQALESGDCANNESSQNSIRTDKEQQKAESSTPVEKNTDASNRTREKSGIEVIPKLEEPLLQHPKIGNPISHGQIISLAKELKSRGISPNSLELLLRGARVYVAPPPVKPEPTSEYKALMARLRREEEARTYDRMTNPPPPAESFSQRFPMSSAAHAFGSNHHPTARADPFVETDEVTYADVDRQMAVVFNVLVSIIACAGAIWVVARWWSTPARLALSLSGSFLVGVAEVVVYSGYVRRVAEAKGKEKAKVEIKEVVKTWVVGQEEQNSTKSQNIEVLHPKSTEQGARKRLVKST